MINTTTSTIKRVYYNASDMQNTPHDKNKNYFQLGDYCTMSLKKITEIRKIDNCLVRLFSDGHVVADLFNPTFIIYND